MAIYYDYKPIPRFKKGDLVYRCWAGIWFHHPEPVSRVFVKEYKGKWRIEYYFPRERTPYGEEDLRATFAEQLKAEAEFIMSKAISELQSIAGIAEKHQINLGASAALLEQLKLPKQ
ncbi:MAG: hypothetical protein KBT34_03010 [Prevotella sp.]|nr:hypothetical protein [Candidatus Prevotella equi]